MNKDQIIQWLKEEIALALNKHADVIDPEANFLRMGIPSIQTLKIINKMRKKLEIDINPIAMFEHKTIFAFADYLSDCFREKVI